MKNYCVLHETQYDCLLFVMLLLIAVVDVAQQVAPLTQDLYSQ